jgi:hypothetical protein
MSNQVKDLVSDLHLTIHELTEENKKLKEQLAIQNEKKTNIL